MNSINLLGHKDQISVPPASQKLRLLRAIAVFLLFGVSATAITLYILISFSALPQVQQQEKQSLATISQYHADITKIALIQDRMTGISSILTKRTGYDNFFQSLQNKMTPDTTIHAISMREKQATVTVKSRSLDSLKILLDNLTSAVVNKTDYAKVTLNSLASDDQSDNFSLTVSITML